MFVVKMIKRPKIKNSLVWK